ncbi:MULTISPECIES: sodium-dependent bicarbonate transport family permease [Thalassospira]|uniref:Membrane protein n=3 Tax=Thalassospira TaxID=168934 RepID=A0A853L4L3_9PROT|nr:MULTISPECIES: sodium-dependent bicarbonate transport family permease [Thalassospira]OAZ14784.1 membrane protein [Thalassospira profundimaris]AXO13341.1 sodium-dependent bicarbonate transport family permease [Thalassospira indica]MBE71162.1 sodium-dependent bicarbonate transport family permease [Thalassospira sp.]MBO6579312.1 sodium-dependent bicarbonate transport family permease [Thalassospira sp.]MBO6801640.1 sodium-dependent bicarbonate transport family permease [Thalassospira sp.]|tara:strand:+ start:4958 stop:5932 length:975 start_codon:yes stop_codon:yes gene_type:complete
MQDVLSLAAQNLLSPIVLFFVLGVGAALARSDLTIPEAVAKGISLYLLFAIGFKGGVAVSNNGIDLTLGMTLMAGVILSFVLPFIAFALLRWISQLSRTDAAAVAGHYGSISIVTFVAATSVLQSSGIVAEGYMVAVAAAMEAPAIFSALLLVSSGGKGRMDGALIREILLNGSIVLLVGSFFIGWITGAEGMAKIEALIVSPFQGVLCLFLLDMGLVAGRGLKQGRAVLRPGPLVFGMLMPVIGSCLGLAFALIIGLSLGGAVLLMVLAASASYIAVPAAMRVALPEANPSVYLTLSLGVTFPFNLTLGIPLYLAMASAVHGG